MPLKKRVPNTISAFNNYINNTDDYQQFGTPISNATRLGLSVQNSLDWKNKRTAWVAMHKKYIDPALSTTIVKQDVRTFISSFKTFSQPLLNIMTANPAATNQDAIIFGFTLQRKKASRPTIPLNATMVLDVRTLGGGDMAFICRTSQDSNRPGKPAGADAVQIALRFGDTAPADANDGTIRELSTKARFTFHAGSANSGQPLYVFARWYNTKYPELAAPWSAMITITVG